MEITFILIIVIIILLLLNCTNIESFINQNKIEKYIKNNIKLIDTKKGCNSKLYSKRNYCSCHIVDENKKIVINKINDYFNNNKQVIPKIIHQIWIGPKKKPDKWLDSFRKDFIQKYPDWQYILWDDDKIDKLKFLNKELYYKKKSYHGKADILRFSLLYKYGGIYIDADTSWLGKSLDELIKKTNKTGFFIGKERKNDNGLASGIVGVSKRNPIIYYMIEIMSRIVPKCKSAPPYISIGPYFCDQVLSGFDVTIFPSYYFYPIYWHQSNPEYKKGNDLDYVIKNYPDSYFHQYGFTTNAL